MIYLDYSHKGGTFSSLDIVKPICQVTVDFKENSECTVKMGGVHATLRISFSQSLSLFCPF